MTTPDKEKIDATAFQKLLERARAEFAEKPVATGSVAAIAVAAVIGAAAIIPGGAWSLVATSIGVAGGSWLVLKGREPRRAFEGGGALGSIFVTAIGAVLMWCLLTFEVADHVLGRRIRQIATSQPSSAFSGLQIASAALAAIAMSVWTLIIGASHFRRYRSCEELAVNTARLCNTLARRAEAAAQPSDAELREQVEDLAPELEKSIRRRARRKTDPETPNR